MSKQRFSNLAVATAITLVELIKADLQIFCRNDAFPDQPPRLTSFEDYSTICEGVCDCYAFELLCVERGDLKPESTTEYFFTLESTNYDAVQECGSNNSCICNYQSEEIWGATANLVGEPLPAPIEVSLPEHSVLKQRAESDDPDREYEKDLYNELSQGTARGDHIVNHPMNEEFYGDLPGFKRSQDVTSLDQECTEFVTCDLYYELDWAIRLRQEMQCFQVLALDPCFATNACVCDNGYFRIAENMPDPPATEEEQADADVIVIENFEEELAEAEVVLEEEKAAEEEAKAEAEALAEAEAAALNSEATGEVTSSEDDSGFETWQYIVAGCVLVLVLVIAGLSIYYCCKCCRKKDSTIKPYPGDIEIASGKDKKSKKIEVGAMGALTQKKRKMKNKDFTGDHSQQPIAPTDDEKSALEIANPDSFLGSSQQNFNKMNDSKGMMQGNAMGNTNYSARSGAKRRSPQSNSPHQMATMDGGDAQNTATSNQLGLPHIQQNAGGPMQYTATGFMQNPHDVASQNASHYSRASRRSNARQEN